MHKLVSFGLVGLAVASLSGCVLAPQVIQLSEHSEVNGQIGSASDALVRVLDERESKGDILGNRGGRSPEDSPLLASKPLTDVLTGRLQDSLKQLGFGEGGGDEPLKMQLAIEKFHYRCNESIIVNECSIEMQFVMTVIDGNKTFTKPYGVNEMRSLAAAPVVEFNQQWVNEVLDKIWQYMFNDNELKQALGVNVGW